MASKKQKIRRDRIFSMHPFCHWCGVKLIHPKEFLEIRGARLRMKRNQNTRYMATLDHLDSRYDETRGMFSGMWLPRTVLACAECNSYRNKLVESKLPKEILHRLAKGERASQVIKYDDGVEYPPEMSFTFGDPV